MKKCSRCKGIKDFKCFCKNKSKSDGLHDQCRDCRKALRKTDLPKRRKYDEANKVHILNLRKKWLCDNKLSNAVYSREYRRNNKARYNAVAARLHAEKMQRTPKWLTKYDLWMMEEIYNLSQERTILTGVQCHVDHKYPLRGKNICGLHVPINLQVITAQENFTKSNKFTQ